MFSLFHFNIAQNTTAAIAPQLIAIQVFQPDPANFQLYTVRVFTYAFFLYSFGVHGFIISTNMLNNVKLKNIFLYYNYGSSLGINTQGIVFGWPGITITPKNAFYGLFYFNSNDNRVSYQLTSTYTQFSEVTLSKVTSNPTYMGFFILVALRNTCDDPFTYD